MVNWTVYNYECEDERARKTLMEWFEAQHPVEFPEDEDSIFAEVSNGDDVIGADYAWIDRYLYVTVTGEAENIIHDTTDMWERAAIATFDGRTETATEVTLIVDTDAGGDDEVSAVSFEGVEGYGGNDVMYALAMEHEFRFRSYSAESPTNQLTPHPAAFDYVDNVDAFVEDLHEVTGVEPTEFGREFVQTDPGAERTDESTGSMSDSKGDQDSLDSVTVVDEDTGEVTEYDSPEDLPDEKNDGGLLSRIRDLLT